MLKLYLFLFRKEACNVAVIYATLIVNGRKTINDVPAVIRDSVKQILIDIGCAELAEASK